MDIKQVAVIGDLHGTYSALEAILEALRQQEFIKVKNGTWSIADHTQLVFLGDYIDRGNEGRKVIETIQNVQTQNQQQVIALLGNHEVMTIYDYCFLNHFAHEKSRELHLDSFQKIPNFVYDFIIKKYHSSNNNINNEHLFIEEFGHTPKQQVLGFLEYMHPNGPIGHWLRTLPLFYKRTIGTTSILCTHADIDDIVAQDFYAHITRLRQAVEHVDDEHMREEAYDTLLNDTSILYSHCFGRYNNTQAKKLCRTLGVDYIFNGHTPKYGTIRTLGNCIHTLDVGMCTGAAPTVLLVRNNKIELLRQDAWKTHPITLH
ncbi:MAG: metallophosphoesterase [Candidatus Woesearchaeota archaeon]